MKRLRAHQTILTEDASIEGRFYKSIIVTKGHTLTIKGDSYHPTTAACLVIVKEGGTLIVNECADITHVCVEGGQAIIKGHCFYIYHKGGSVTIDGGDVTWVEFKNLLDGGYDGKRELTIKNGHVSRLSCGSNGKIHAYKSTIHYIEIGANIALNLQESKVEKGFMDHYCFIIHLGDMSSEICNDVKLGDTAYQLYAQKTPLDFRQAREKFYYTKNK